MAPRPIVASRTRNAGASLLAIALSFAATPAVAVPRLPGAPAKVQGSGLVFTTHTVADSLIQCLLGSDVPIRNATLTGEPGSAGTFTGGNAIIGFESGVAIGSGLIETAVGPNQSFGAGTGFGGPGDADLDALIDPEDTFDAAVLEFEFFTDVPRTFTFEYVFASEEYSEFVGEGFDDVVAFFLNGTGPASNIALVPAACLDSTGIPISVDNVNCGNIVDPQVPETNCACYVDNEFDPLTFPPPPTPIDTEMDGLTQVFVATGTTVAGWNRLKIAIADAGDDILDSNVFIRCQSLIVPVRGRTWGEVKTRYR